MITIESSIPKKSDSFLKGLDIFYTQFNDVNFYIEDEDQENFYFEILRRLFPDIKLNKIFPLNGKKNVLAKAKKNIGNKKRVFIVDKDFDDLLGKKISQANLFYLEKYSIENYLIEEESIKVFIMEEKPKLKLRTIDKIFKMPECLKTASRIFYEISLCHLFVQAMKLPIKNTSTPPDRYINFGSTISLKPVEIVKYKNSIQHELSKIDGRFKVQNQLRKLKKQLNIKNDHDFFKDIPGKYLVKYFKCKIGHLFNISNINDDSFIYRLAKNNSFSTLDFLQKSINAYINS